MHVYFLGIGGSGIGPLALLASQAGYSVSGSDKISTSYLDYLKDHGVSNIAVGSDPELINEAHANQPIDWLVYSSAIDFDEDGQKQLERARALGIKCTKRDEFIKQFLLDNNLKMIAIAGTHGKTTTTAMVVWLFLSLKKPISYLLAAKVSFGEMASFDRQSSYFIYEADEFDHNFLAFKPALSLITGVSWDHHEIYPTKESYLSAFNDFIAASEEVVIWSEDTNGLQLKTETAKVLDQADPKTVGLRLKGLFNRRDGWLAISGLKPLLKDVSETDLVNKINEFPGVSRRMEELAPNLYSDYAHTPEKIRGAMSAALEIASVKKQPVIVIYEPLTNRRQHHVIDEYKDCFKGSEHIYWLPSYLAREDSNTRVIKPAELISRLNQPEIAEPAELDEALLSATKDHLKKGHMVVGMAGGGGGSLDDWLREHFSSDR